MYISEKIDADTPGHGPVEVPTSCCGVGEITYVGAASEAEIKECLYNARWVNKKGIVFATTGKYVTKKEYQSPAAKTLAAVGFKPVMEAINPRYSEADAFGYAMDPGHKTILWAYDVTTIPKRKG